MATPSVNQLEFLTPGSVWTRKDGRTAKFLFVSNDKLKAKTQLKHPPQIIYSDPDGNVFNRDVDDFLESYSFYNVDDVLERKLESLFVFTEDDYEESDEETDGEETAEESDEETDGVDILGIGAQSTLADQLADELADSDSDIELRSSVKKSTKSGVQVGFAFAEEEGLTDSPLTAQDLTDALVVYSQDPNENYSLTQHRLMFELSDKITLKTLRDAFAPSETASTVDAFEVRTALESTIVYWTSFIGVYPEYSTNGLFASVLVGTDESPVSSSESYPEVPLGMEVELEDEDTGALVQIPEVQEVVVEQKVVSAETIRSNIVSSVPDEQQVVITPEPQPSKSTIVGAVSNVQVIAK
jgi:hypothetical protein